MTQATKEIQREEKRYSRHEAYRLYNRALKNKVLVRQPCEVCGKTKRIHGHHSDYSRPLDVRWLCHEHHFEEHRRLRGSPPKKKKTVKSDSNLPRICRVEESCNSLRRAGFSFIKMSRTYRVRTDNGIAMPDAIRNLLNWKVGDEMDFVLDFTRNSLTVTKNTDKETQ